MHIVNRIGSSTKRAATSKEFITIPANSTKTVPFRLRGKQALLADRDLMFIPKYIDGLGHEGGVLSHIVDANTTIVQIRNTSNKSFFLSARYRLDTMQEYEEEECYLATSANAHLTANSEIARHEKSITKNWIKKAVIADVAALAAFQDIVKSTSAISEMIISFEIIVYDESAAQA